jgi:hypothetical protein
MRLRTALSLVPFVGAALLTASAPTAVGGWPSKASVAASGFRPQALVHVGTGPDIVVAGAVPCGRGEYCPSAIVAAVPADGLVHGWRQFALPAPAPAPSPTYGAPTHLVFLNGLDGYDLAATSPFGTRAGLYATHNGGESWERVPTEGRTVLHVAAGGRELFAVTAHCRGSTCTGYRLASVPLDGAHWRSVALPGAAAMSQLPVTLAGLGDEAFVEFQPTNAGALPRLDVFRHQKLVVSRTALRLWSDAACYLYPQSGGPIWAACGTGMMVTYLRSNSARGRFADIWTYPGTGGGGLLPVTGSVAYRFTGIAGRGVGADQIERSDEGGRNFAHAGPWPFASSSASARQFLFIGKERGFALGPAPAGGHSLEVVETADGGRHWTAVVP